MSSTTSRSTHSRRWQRHRTRSKVSLWALVAFLIALVVLGALSIGSQRHSSTLQLQAQGERAVLVRVPAIAAADSSRDHNSDERVGSDREEEKEMEVIESSTRDDVADGEGEEVAGTDAHDSEYEDNEDTGVVADEDAIVHEGEYLHHVDGQEGDNEDNEDDDEAEDGDDGIVSAVRGNFDSRRNPSFGWHSVLNRNGADWGSILLRPPKSREELSPYYYRTMEALYVMQNLTYAVELAKEGAAEGHGRLHWLLGVLHANGVGVPQSDVRAILHHTFAAMEGVPEAHIALGYRHKIGIAVERSCDAAVAHYREAADAVAMTYDGTMNPGLPTTRRLPNQKSDSRGDPVLDLLPHDAELVQIHTYRADSGNSESKLMLGYAHLKGSHGLQKDWHRAREFFLDALQSNKAALGALGQLYAVGGPTENPPIPRDLRTAAYYFQQGIASNDPVSLNGLGYLHTIGIDDESAQTAAPWNQPVETTSVAPKGRRSTRTPPSNALPPGATGPRIEKDFSKAYFYFHESALRRNAEGLYNLGVLHLHGRGTYQDTTKALSLFREAAALGSVLAHWQLGRMQYYGLGGQPASCDFALRSYQHVVRYGSWYQREFIGSLMLQEDRVGSSVKPGAFSSWIDSFRLPWFLSSLWDDESSSKQQHTDSDDTDEYQQQQQKQTNDDDDDDERQRNKDEDDTSANQRRNERSDGIPRTSMKPSPMTEFIDYLILAETGHFNSGWNAAYMLQNSATMIVEGIVSDDLDSELDSETRELSALHANTEKGFAGQETWLSASKPEEKAEPAPDSVDWTDPEYETSRFPNVFSLSFWREILSPFLYYVAGINLGGGPEAADSSTTLGGSGASTTSVWMMYDNGVTPHGIPPVETGSIRLAWPATAKDRIALRLSARSLLAWASQREQGLYGAVGGGSETALIRSIWESPLQQQQPLPRFVLLPQRDARQLLVLRLLQLCALAGDAESNLQLGNYYYYGYSGRYGVDMRRARAFYEIAANQRNAQALFNMGIMHQFGLGSTESESGYDGAAAAAAAAAGKKEPTHGARPGGDRAAHAGTTLGRGTFFNVEDSDEEIQLWIERVLESELDRVMELSDASKRKSATTEKPAHPFPVDGSQNDVRLPRTGVGAADYADDDDDDDLMLFQILNRPPRGMWQTAWSVLNSPPSVSTRDLHLAKRFYDEALSAKAESTFAVRLALTSLNYQWWWSYYAMQSSGWIGFSAKDMFGLGFRFSRTLASHDRLIVGLLFVATLLICMRRYVDTTEEDE